MINFYKKASAILLVLLAVSTLLGVLCALLFFNTEHLFPAQKSIFPWHIETMNEWPEGSSSISVSESADTLGFSYRLSETNQFPYVRLYLAFDDLRNASEFVDLSPYYKLSFKVRCSQQNVMSFNLRTLDQKVTKKEDPGSYRMSSHWFDCQQQWKSVEVDLKHMEVPIWWLEAYNAGVHDRTYLLDKVLALSFVSSRHGPLGNEIEVQVRDIVVHNYLWAYLIVFVLCCVVIWLGYFYWAFKLHSQYLEQYIQKKYLNDKPLAAYQRVSLESNVDRERSAVLKYLNEQYAQPGMTMEKLIDELGISRKKVNEILKDEIGFTFKTYLNKLRLTEAARLLCEQPDQNISDIACSVGYRNVTHFNKIFKDEFGCSPGKFKTLKSKKTIVD